MTNELSDVDLDRLGGTEQHERYQALDRLQREKQLSLPSLDLLSDAELAYLAGHRNWIESEHDHESVGNRAAVERATLGTQQKVRGNAWRAKDLLDHRLTTRQLHALEASNSALEASNAVVADSNRHMRVTAQATRRLAFWTIALVVVTLLVGLVTLFTDPDVDLRPEINVDVAPTSSSTTVAPTSTTVAPTTATDEAP